MTRLLVILTFVACLLTSTLSAAKLVPAPAPGPTALFTCTQHGPKMMVLTLAYKEGLGGRSIHFTGANEGQTWQVCINGHDDTPAEQTPDSKSSIEVRANDNLVWQISNLTHGVTFADKAAAEALLDIDVKASKPLSPRMEAKFKGFGPDPWGTDPIPSTPGQTTILVVAKVKAVGAAGKDKK
jgi:hypothetical protein